ncbi:hypothetical protein E8E13_003152 [Curvularia kusanoi]|uniref:Uncharacterized protein n=1 Tax=Curvularia kusanoi TaxID=90978 RepID=A0A9P4W915_CURKU|nr:hypothetical protein E8E13_003152 [Curvularia kusanoi]
MARHNSRRRRKDDCDEPYNPLPRPRGFLAAPASLQHGAQGWWVGGAWIEPPAPKYEQRSLLSPIVIDKSEDSDCYEVLPPTQSVKPSPMPQSAPFDFNNGEQTLPWVKPLGRPSNHTARSFADSADGELLSYLADRSISRGFLVEIDHLLKDHPEISDHPEGREMIMQVNSLSPLEAYKYFLRGYTRPARYIDGVIRSDHFVMPAQYPYRPLSTKNDPELVDFFEGFEYRWDIIDRIDKMDYLGVDIVDFVMDEIPVQLPARRTYDNNTRPQSRPIAQQLKIHPTSSRSTRRRKNNKIRVQSIPPALQTQATELRSAKANLERAYNQEQNVMDLKARCTGVSFSWSDIIAARARAERRYVNCLIRYARNANLMSPVQARELQANFTRRKMEASGMNNRSYLLGLFPRELK